MSVAGSGGPRIVVMGVSGSGKSSVGAAFAAALDLPFSDADDLHPPANVAKMAAGTPLTDEDRWPWLDDVGTRLAEGRGHVVACSALREAYRDRLRAAVPDAWFLLLDPSRETLVERMRGRAGHFMPVSLLDSQLATLEPLSPHEAGLRTEAQTPPDAIVATAVERHRAFRAPLA